MLLFNIRYCFVLEFPLRNEEQIFSRVDFQSNYSQDPESRLIFLTKEQWTASYFYRIGKTPP
jgi:hypothetical protein